MTPAATLADALFANVHGYSLSSAGKSIIGREAGKDYRFKV
jgi:hypothetical protein